MSLELFLRRFFVCLLPYARISDDEELEKQLTRSVLNINTRCNREEIGNRKISDELEERIKKEEEERKKKEEEEDEFSGCDTIQDKVEEVKSVEPEGQNSTLHTILFSYLKSWHSMPVAPLKGEDSSMNEGERKVDGVQAVDVGIAGLNNSTKASENHTAESGLRVTTSLRSSSSGSSSSSSSGSGSGGQAGHERSEGIRCATRTSSAVVTCTVRAWLNGSYLLSSNPSPISSSSSHPIMSADPVSFIPWQIASILLESDREKEQISSYSNGQEGSQSSTSVLKCILLECLLGILESSPGSSSLLIHPISDEGHEGSNEASIQKESKNSHSDRRTEFLVSVRVALCNALLPSLLTLLSSPTSLKHDLDINPTSGPASHQEPSVCDVKTQFLCVRFLFSALSVVPSERHSAFLTLVLPPISSYLCTVTSGTSCHAFPCLPLLALPCLALPCLALPCLALPCLALPCLALPCLALPCLALLHLSSLDILYLQLTCSF
jgi:hypothetical protein